MPHDIFPSTVKALINSLTGAMCERMSKIFQFTSFLHRDVSYYVNEAGLPADDFKADLCEALADCLGDGGSSGEPPNPNMAAPEALTASDDAYADKIVIDWSPVSGATQYKLYRSNSSSFSGATLLATINHPTVEYDDTTATPGTNYWYWARATDGTDTSALSNRDQGRAASGGDIGVLDAIEDLRATVGFGTGHIALVWTPPTGATLFDVYRATSNDFEEAEVIYEDVSPASTTSLLHPDDAPTAWDNVGEMVLYDIPMSGGVTPLPVPNQDFYYWIVAKKNSPPAVSPESNSAMGRINPPAIYDQSDVTLQYGDDDEYEVPAGMTKMWAVLFPSGAGGAGGSSVYGGGGGGGGGVVQEAFDVAEGDVISIVHTGPTPDSGNAESTADGDDGAITELKINGVEKLTSNGGHGGHYNAAGGGLGGDADTATGDVDPTIYAGHAGLPAVGATGGRSGYYFSGRRLPAANALGVYNGNGLVGSGATAVAADGTLAVGGSGSLGRAFLKFGT